MFSVYVVLKTIPSNKGEIYVELTYLVGVFSDSTTSDNVASSYGGYVERYVLSEPYKKSVYVVIYTYNSTADEGLSESTDVIGVYVDHSKALDVALPSLNFSGEINIFKKNSDKYIIYYDENNLENWIQYVHPDFFIREIYIKDTEKIEKKMKNKFGDWSLKKQEIK